MTIDDANKKAMDAVLNAHPFLTGIGIARETLPGMDGNTILHAGPPLTWEKMAGPVRGAVIGALLYEKKVKNRKEAEKLASSGEIKYAPCHHHSAVGPMAGIISPKMPVFIVENKTAGNRAYATLNEGLGKVLRFGAYGPDVMKRLRWMESVLAPVLRDALALSGPIDLKNIIAQAVQMGDECHNRNKAATSLLFRELASHIASTKNSRKKIKDVLNFINGNDHFFLNLSMAASKAALASAENIDKSTLVVTMARNATEFGIRISGLGEMWFTAPAPLVDGLYFPGFSKADAAGDLGDSAITETSGIGGFAMATAPAIVKFVGGAPEDAVNYTNEMYEITMAENNVYKMPALNFRGTPTGIDFRKVLETDIMPIINTGIAHKSPGVGQVGAGIVRAPKKCFEDALRAFAEKYAK